MYDDNDLMVEAGAGDGMIFLRKSHNLYYSYIWCFIYFTNRVQRNVMRKICNTLKVSLTDSKGQTGLKFQQSSQPEYWNTGFEPVSFSRRTSELLCYPVAAQASQSYHSAFSMSHHMSYRLTFPELIPYRERRNDLIHATQVADHNQYRLHLCMGYVPHF